MKEIEIVTSRGLLSLDELRIGDLVPTRLGWRRLRKLVEFDPLLVSIEQDARVCRAFASLFENLTEVIEPYAKGALSCLERGRETIRNHYEGDVKVLDTFYQHYEGICKFNIEHGSPIVSGDKHAVKTALEHMAEVLTLIAANEDYKAEATPGRM